MVDPDDPSASGSKGGEQATGTYTDLHDRTARGNKRQQFLPVIRHRQQGAGQVVPLAGVDLKTCPTVTRAPSTMKPSATPNGTGMQPTADSIITSANSVAMSESERASTSD